MFLCLLLFISIFHRTTSDLPKDNDPSPGVADADFSFVVAIRVDFVDDVEGNATSSEEVITYNRNCQGVLIAPNWALTHYACFRMEGNLIREIPIRVSRIHVSNGHHNRTTRTWIDTKEGTTLIKLDEPFPEDVKPLTSISKKAAYRESVLILRTDGEEISKYHGDIPKIDHPFGEMLHSFIRLHDYRTVACHIDDATMKYLASRVGIEYPDISSAIGFHRGGLIDEQNYKATREPVVFWNAEKKEFSLQGLVDYLLSGQDCTEASNNGNAVIAMLPVEYSISEIQKHVPDVNIISV